MIAAVVLACAAIVIPFALHGLQDKDAGAAPTTPVTTAAPRPAVNHQATADPALGTQGDLPFLLPARTAGLRDGLRVRVGDITEGSLRRTPAAGWQVVVRWDGRLQPLTMRGPVAVSDGTSWVATSGFVYTRVPTGTPGRFRVYAWDPQGGTAYTPPALVSTSLGVVCFNSSFTAFGGCRAG